MAFRPGPPGFPMGPPFGFPQPQGIFFNPMIGRGFPPSMAPSMPTAKPTAPPRVFVGNISEKCTNEFIQRMLQECGGVASWKRIQGSNGKYQAFGFCDFETPEGTLRALRILNDFQIGEKKLVVKAEDKVLTDLRAWALAKRKEEGKPDLKLKDSDLPADDDDMKQDEEIRLKILNWIETDHPELLIVTEDGELSDKEKDAKSKKDAKRKDDRSKENRNRRRRSRSRSNSRSKYDRKRGRSRSPKRRRNRRSSSRSSRSSSESSYSSDSSRSRSVSPKRRNRRSRSRDSSASDAEERKQLKRELKAKEKNYQAHLKKWEEREKEKARYYEKIERKEKERKMNMLKEAKKMKHFLEDYDDEKDDSKYYRSSCLFQRKRDFDWEREADTKDRLKEQTEIEELKKQIMEQNADAAAAEEMARKKHREQEEAAMRRLRGDSGSPNPHQPLGQGDEDSSSSGSDSEKMEENGSNVGTPQNLGFISTTGQPEKWTSEEIKSGEPNETNGVAVNASAPVVKQATVPAFKSNLSARLENVFGVDDEEDVDQLRTRKRLKPFEITAEDRMANLTEAERKKMMKDLISKIPTQKADLFAYNIDWTQVDTSLANNKVRPWVAKKIKEFIGEEEPALTDFICDKVVARTSPQEILKDVAVILDEDAEVFVVKMWRLLIYESESKKLGLQK